jgi:CheY-like chemotaxis protein
MLAGSFDVVGMATDGREGLELARRLDPDAIVLDINMPGVDGFQTMRALERTGSRASVVFLSLLGDDEHISEAFRLGGRAYVVKSRMLSDLAVALDQVLLGGRFVPSLSSLAEITGACGHAMHVYGSEESFADALVSCFDLALHRGDAACLVAAPSIRDRVTTGLRARGWDVGSSTGMRRYRTIDTHAALADLVRGGLPDPTRLAEVVEELDEYRRTACDGSSSRLTIVGDLSGSLKAAGNPGGAHAMERLWNIHTEGRPFLTVCGYSVSGFGDASDDWSTTASEHSTVCHANDV